MNHKIAALAAAAACLAATSALAQVMVPEGTATSTVAQVKVPEGTEFPIRVEDTLSSSTAHEGDRFTISLDDDVKLSDGTVLRAGYRGVGEVVEAKDNGAMGKSGKLNIRLVYLKVGDDRIRLRANKGAQGEARVGSTVATVILFWPAAPFIKGKDVSINKGTTMTAYSDQDITLATPVAPPPADAE